MARRERPPKQGAEYAEQQDNSAPAAGRKPEYAAYSVQETRDGKGFWNRIGAGWEHKDDMGIDVQLDSLPINGRVTLRAQVDERLKEYEEERAAQGQIPRDPGRGYER